MYGFTFPVGKVVGKKQFTSGKLREILPGKSGFPFNFIGAVEKQDYGEICKSRRKCKGKVRGKFAFPQDFSRIFSGSIQMVEILWILYAV